MSGKKRNTKKTKTQGEVKRLHNIFKGDIEEKKTLEDWDARRQEELSVVKSCITREEEHNKDGPMHRLLKEELFRLQTIEIEEYREEKERGLAFSF